MAFDERHHAWILSEFYDLLLNEYREQGERVFLFVSRTYGEQRGKRMAMRALRDNRPLDFVSYFAYGELELTDQFFDVKSAAKQGEVVEKVTRCPWAAVFAQRNLVNCGVVYCTEIDRAVLRGFNPDLLLQVRSTQHRGKCCEFHFQDSEIDPHTLERAASLAKGLTDATAPMAYHCAHLYHTFAQLLPALFPAQGGGIPMRVLQGFEKTYGEEAGRTLIQNTRRDFLTI